MILAIRAFRATIFAFNDAIEVAIAALPSVTVAVAETAAPALDAIVAPSVFDTDAVPAPLGINTVEVDFPPMTTTIAPGVVPVTLVVEAPLNSVAYTPSDALFPAESFTFTVRVPVAPAEYDVLSKAIVTVDGDPPKVTGAAVALMNFAASAGSTIRIVTESVPPEAAAPVEVTVQP